MADVARAAGVTKAALYYHFTDKSDLYTTVALARIASIHEAMEEAANEGGTLEERLVRLAIVGFERLESDVYAPHLHAHEHLDEAHHQQLHKAMDELQEPVIRCFAEAGPADAQLSPKAASELLGGVLFSLIFAPGRRAATARCRRTASSGRRWRSGCSSAATGRSRGARTSRPEEAGCRVATAITRPGSSVQAWSAWSSASASSAGT